MKKNLFLIFIFLLNTSSVFAYSQGNWTIDSSGVVTSVGEYVGGGTFEFLSNNTLNNGSGRCYGSIGGSGTTSSWLINKSVYSTGGLGTAGCTTAGYYYANFSGGWSYVLYYTGTTTDPINPDYSTRIISIIPESNTTVIPFVASTSDRFADFDVDLLNYYNGTTTPISVITTNLKNNDVPSYQYSTTTISGFGSGNATTSYNIAHNVPFGSYSLVVTLLDSSLNIIDSTTSNPITFGSTTSAPITFQDVYGASSSDLYDIGQLAPTSNCSITDITGCFKNAVVWAFYPSSASLEIYA